MNSLHEELLKVEFKILRESKGISQLEIAHKLRINLSVIQTIDDKAFDKSNLDVYLIGYMKAYAGILNIQVYTQEKNNLVSSPDLRDFSNRNKKINFNFFLLIFVFIIFFSILFLYFQRLEEQNKRKNIELNNAQPISLKKKLVVPTIDYDAVKHLFKINDNHILKVYNSPLYNKLEYKKFSNKDIDYFKKITNPDEVEILFSGNCWVEIYDKNLKKLYFGLQKQKQTLIVSGSQPLKFIFGAPGNVKKMFFKGKKVDLNKFNPNKVAKFSLPNEELIDD